MDYPTAEFVIEHRNKESCKNSHRNTTQIKLSDSFGKWNDVCGSFFPQVNYSIIFIKCTFGVINWWHDNESNTINM